MSKFVDYLLMKPPKEFRFQDSSGGQINAPESTDQVPTRRIIYSVIGLILGIFLSFVLTGLQKIPSSTPNNTTTTAAEVSNSSSDTIKFRPMSLQEVAVTLLLSLVICLLTYQGLYSSLRLHKNEPAWLIVVISFQYGFFWQSFVKGGALLVT
jgi:hypothetical protein